MLADARGDDGVVGRRPVHALDDELWFEGTVLVHRVVHRVVGLPLLALLAPLLKALAGGRHVRRAFVGHRRAHLLDDGAGVAQ